ncbi:MAG: sulfurtransferase TusA family protein [Armatimonadota bacterium]
MSTVQSLYRLPASLGEDLEQLRLLIEQFQAGDISAARLQAFRVPQGVYEQRENGAYMLRVRLPAGIFLPEQMRAVAEIARKYGNGQLHFTSRQDIQVHRVPVEHIHPALVELAGAGLSTKGGGGNTVRNITACQQAGVCPHELFDVTPYVIGLTEYLLPDPLSYQLPRKYKIAFSGCAGDCAAATVQDLGFISKIRDGVEGFAVYVGGGMGATSMVGQSLEEFIPASGIYAVAEAVKRVFDQHGNRKNRHKARLRFLIKEIGIAKFTELYQAEKANIQVTPPEIAGIPAPLPAAVTDPRPPAAGFEQWRETHVSRQKQAGYFTVEITPPLGVIDADGLDTLAEIIDRYGERMLRATIYQGAVLRWVPEDRLTALHAELSAIGLGESKSKLQRRLVACAGAATCRLGICLARGMAEAIASGLAKSDLDLSDGTGEVSLNISGCPNSCGRHPIGEIGFYGAARRVGGHLVPHYVLQLGAIVEEGKTRLAEGNIAIPAHNVPAFMVEFLRAFRQSPRHPDFMAFLAADGRQVAEEIAQRHLHVPEFAEDKNYYYDWGAQELFSLAGRGPGECGAGVFDLIEVDLASAGEALEAGKLFAATALTARALLITRGEQVETHQQALAFFQQHFVEQGLLPDALRPLIANALQAVKTADPEAAFSAEGKDVAELLAEIRRQYENMGPSLRVAAPVSCGVTPVATPQADPVPADLSVDFRGVSCPLNYVKTKMALAKLTTGQVLAVTLDGEGAKNVPASATNDGHEIVALIEDCCHWRVLIRKK